MLSTGIRVEGGPCAGVVGTSASPRRKQNVLVYPTKYRMTPALRVPRGIDDSPQASSIAVVEHDS
jgi:hypothetical protein